jgi:hypothetical protein
MLFFSLKILRERFMSLDPKLTNPYYYMNCYPDWGYFPKSLFKAGSPYENSQIYEGTYYDFQKESTWNKLSYIPVLNIIVGIIRLMDAMDKCNSNFSSPYRETRYRLQILRGCSDILLGPVNCIIDLFVTIARIIIANSATNSTTQRAAT